MDVGDLLVMPLQALPSVDPLPADPFLVDPLPIDDFYNDSFHIDLLRGNIIEQQWLESKEAKGKANYISNSLKDHLK